MLRKNFPKVDELPVWKEWDWQKEPAFNSIVMSEIAREMVSWAKEGNYSEVKTMLSHVEQAFTGASELVVAYLGTDFTVTILETEEKDIRKKIKSLMGPATAHAYKLNLNGYREPN